MFSYDFLTCFLHVFSVFISTYIYQSNEKDPRLTLQWYAGGMIVDNGVLEKKCQTPGKKKYILELEKHFKAPTVMWSPGPLVFYSFGVVLWSLGTLVLWYEVLWCFMFYLMPGCCNASTAEMRTCWFMLVPSLADTVRMDTMQVRQLLSFPHTPNTMQNAMQINQRFQSQQHQHHHHHHQQERHQQQQQQTLPEHLPLLWSASKCYFTCHEIWFFLRILKPPQFHVYCTVHERGLINPNNCKTEI